MTRELTPGQRVMVEDGLPAALLLTPEERAAAWKGQRLTKMLDVASRPRQQGEQDPGTAKLIAELDAQAKAAAKQKKADRKEAGIIRARRKVRPQPEQENDMAKKTKPAAKKAPAKKVKKVAAAKPAKAPKAPKADGQPSTQDQVMALLCRPAGATMEQLVAETGIEAHAMRSKIKRCRELKGISVDSEAYEGPSKENGNVYRILVDKLPKTAQAAE
jgi:hypothetical protein